jgi:hypothetical protein
VLIKLPILVAIGAEPIAAIIMPLVRKTHGNAVVTKGPELLDKPIVKLAAPLADQEGFNCLSTLKKFRSVSPTAIRTFCAAVSGVKGGSGGRLISFALFSSSYDEKIISPWR